MMRRALVAVVALALALSAPALASAARSGGSSDRAPSAQVQAAGSGTMTISGRLTITGTIPEHGTVVVTVRGRDGRAYLAGEPLDLDRRGTARVKRASGILFVTGSRVTVRIAGSGLTFSIAGNGRARFAGSGVYQLNGDPQQSWSKSWVRIAPSSSTERRRERRCAKCSSSAARQR
jgi:hypothetical protein